MTLACEKNRFSVRCVAPTNEMCDVEEGDIRNKGNRERKKCY